MVRGLGFPGGSSGLLEGFRTTPRALAFQPLDSSLGWEEGKRHQPAVSAGAGAGEQEVWAGVVCSLGWAGAPLPIRSGPGPGTCLFGCPGGSVPGQPTAWDTYKPK